MKASVFDLPSSDAPTLRLTNIAMGNGASEDVVPYIKWGKLSIAMLVKPLVQQIWGS